MIFCNQGHAQVIMKFENFPSHTLVAICKLKYFDFLGAVLLKAIPKKKLDGISVQQIK